MEKSLRIGRSRKATLLVLGALLLVIGLSIILYSVKSRTKLESISFMMYKDPEMEINITATGSGYYVLVAKKGKNFRLGIMNETMLMEFMSSANLILDHAEKITFDEFNSSRINNTQGGLSSKEPTGANLTIIDDVRIDIQIFSNLTLIQLTSPKKITYYRSTSLDLRDYFEELYNWSKNQTIKALNLIWIKLRERGRAPFKYRIGAIKINLTSDEPIQITMVWQGCPCHIRPPETFQFSVEEIVGG